MKILNSFLGQLPIYISQTRAREREKEEKKTNNKTKSTIVSLTNYSIIISTLIIIL